MAKRVRVSGYARVRRVGSTVVVTQVKPYRRSPPKAVAVKERDAELERLRDHDHAP